MVLATVSNLPSVLLVPSVLLSALAVYLVRRLLQLPPLSLKYPPGPVEKNLLSGNKSDIAVPSVWKKYTEWAKQYGDIIHVRAFRQHIIVLNTQEAAVNLFERRSKKYSTRPSIPMYELMGFTGATSLSTYGKEWQRHRRIFQQGFKPESALAYTPIQARKAYDMIYEIMKNPEDFEKIIYTYAGAIILSVVYGINVKQKDDPYIKLSESTSGAFGIGPLPTWLVNHFPILRHVPAWLPGAGFKRYANFMQQVITEQRYTTFAYANNLPSTFNGSQIPLVTRMLKSCSSEFDIKVLRHAAGSAYGAGVATTASTIMAFLVAMLSYPEVQKKAQAEIDRITGSKRLPDFGDRPSSPYLQAVIREVIRWRPLVPLGLAHSTTEDDVYNGYYIPKGSTIYANIWAITRDSERYKDPEEFIPERFLTETGELNNEDTTYAFGFGRRICPGRHLGLASIWIAAATILSSFNIVNKKDESGHDLPVQVSYTERGITCTPYELQGALVLRSEQAGRFIMETRSNSESLGR